MNIPALTCQLEQAAGSLNHGYIEEGSLDDLRSLAGASELLTNVVYGLIRQLVEKEQEAKTPEPGAKPIGLLDLLGKGGVA
jgi:hypothetical protein